MADLDSFDEINSEGVSHDYYDNRETEVFDTTSSISEYEPDSTTHLPKEIKLLLCCSNVVVVLLSLNPFIEIRIRNNSSSSDVPYIQASMSISPKYESK